MLLGKLVRLRALEQHDYGVLAEWLNDPDVMVYWGRPGNTVSVEEVARQEQHNAARGNSRKYIIETLGGRPIGQIDYYDLDWQARSAWTSIMVGEREFWSGGYGTDAMRTLIAYLIDEMGLHRVALTVHRTNERAQKSYRKNGFVEEGVLRDWAFFGGQWIDGIIMAVLEPDIRHLAAFEPVEQSASE
jgi:RimJ/RimL family protein N-acetyltransferase